MVVRKKRQVSRANCSELLFGGTFVRGGLNRFPSFTDECLRVVRVAVKVFDELLCVVAWSSSGFKDES